MNATTAARREAPHHNTLTCYTDYRCRRPECVDRYNAHARAYRQAKADGTWNRYIEAAPVLQHLRTLTASGLTLGRIATVTGIPLQTLIEISRRRYRTTPENAAKILAITPGQITPTRVDATGTRRRLQALVAIGWPLERIAPYANIHPRNISNITRQKAVNATTAEAVADTYTRLRTMRPGRRGITRQQIHRAKKRAAANRWPTPSYWDLFPDAIDDPDFVPDYGKTRAEILAEDARWLVDRAGLDRARIAERLEVDRSYLDRALTAHPAAGTETAA